MRALAIKQRLPSVTCTCTFSFKIFCAIKTIENQLSATFTESLLKSKLKRLQINLKILLWGNSYVCLARWGSLETTSSLFFLSPLSETCETRTRHARDGTRETGLPSLINLRKRGTSRSLASLFCCQRLELQAWEVKYLFELWRSFLLCRILDAVINRSTQNPCTVIMWINLEKEI